MIQRMEFIYRANLNGKRNKNRNKRMIACLTVKQRK